MSGNELILLAPLSGVIYSLERVPDRSKKSRGGFWRMPSQGELSRLAEIQSFKTVRIGDQDYDYGFQ
jgi:hypothetical protein